MFKKKIIAAFATFLLASVFIFSSESAMSAYVEGCLFYADEDWPSAKIMLKKAVSYSENFNPDVYYMLITAEVYDGDEKTALDDCNVFLKNFPDSNFYSRVKYHKGRILFNLGEYEKAILELSDFCHQYVGHELYSHALFYIGESLYAGFKYDEAQAIFERVVTEFPNSEKKPAAQYRIDTILQRSREEKLLYLLKQTGEEYLSAKEEYEKQLKMYNSDTITATRQKLEDSQAKNNVLEKQVADLELQLEVMKAESAQIADLEAQLESIKAEAEKLAAEKERLEKEKNEAEALAASRYVPEATVTDVPVIEKTNTEETVSEREVIVPDVVVPEKENTEAKVISEEKKTVSEEKKTVPEEKKPVPEEKKPVPEKKESGLVSEEKEKNVKETVPDKKPDVAEESVEKTNDAEETKKAEKAPADNKKQDVKKSDSDNLEVPNMEPYDETREQLRILKEKANTVQKYMKENYSE